MIVGIILAAGKGTRIRSKDRNKVTLPFLNKPLIIYSVELMQAVCDKTVVVIGAFAQSVKAVLKKYPIIYAYQKEQLGTAHAVQVGLDKIKSFSHMPDIVLVGYGDHMMYYSLNNAAELIKYHKEKKAVMTIVTTMMEKPFGYGRIIRNAKKNVIAIVEEKEAGDKVKKIKEINAGLYCFNYDFLKNNLKKIQQSSVSNEYYLPDLVKIAIFQNMKVAGLVIPYSNVGIGINRTEELEESQKLYLNRLGH